MNITKNTMAKHIPMIGKLTKYLNALRFQAGDSVGSNLPVTILSINEPWKYASF